MSNKTPEEPGKTGNRWLEKVGYKPSGIYSAGKSTPRLQPPDQIPDQPKSSRLSKTVSVLSALSTTFLIGMAIRNNSMLVKSKINEIFDAKIFDDASMQMESILQNEALRKKLREGTVQISLGDSEGGGEGHCAGFILQPTTIVTAAHCTHGDDGKLRTLKAVNTMNEDGGGKRSTQEIFSDKKKGGVRYQIIRDIEKDLAIIVFEKPIFDPKRALSISDGVLQENNAYAIVGHPLGDEWKVDAEVDEGINQVGVLNGGIRTLHKMSGRAFPGNSGGPVADINGYVLGVVSGGNPDHTLQSTYVTLARQQDVVSLMSQVKSWDEKRQPQDAPVVQDVHPKADQKVEKMPETAVTDKGLKPIKPKKKNSALGQIMASDTGSLNSKMAVAMKGDGSSLSVGHGTGDMRYRGPKQTTAQSRRAIHEVLRVK
ncbi:MAG: serine protease [Candidatus Gracilibacteria bacterium]